MTAAPSPLLEVRDLEIAFPAGKGWSPVVRGAAFDVGRGEVVGLVGESGSGKTLTALALLGLVPPPGRVTAGSARLQPAATAPPVPGAAGAVDLLRLDPRELLDALPRLSARLSARPGARPGAGAGAA